MWGHFIKDNCPSCKRSSQACSYDYTKSWPTESTVKVYIAYMYMYMYMYTCLYIQYICTYNIYVPSSIHIASIHWSKVAAAPGTMSYRMASLASSTSCCICLTLCFDCSTSAWLLRVCPSKALSCTLSNWVRGQIVLQLFVSWLYTSISLLLRDGKLHNVKPAVHVCWYHEKNLSMPQLQDWQWLSTSQQCSVGVTRMAASRCMASIGMAVFIQVQTAWTALLELAT